MILDGIEILSLATILELQTEGEDAEIDLERFKLISEAFMVAIEVSFARRALKNILVWLEYLKLLSLSFRIPRSSKVQTFTIQESRLIL